MKGVFSFLLFIGLMSCKYNKQSAIASLVTLPSFNLMLMDSTKISTSNQIPLGNPIVFIYFETDCHFCQAETKSILNNINSISNVKLYFLTPMSLQELKAYNDTYHLSDYKNIIVAKDYGNSFGRIFKPSSVPFIAIYNKNKELVKIYKGSTSVEAIIEAVRI